MRTIKVLLADDEPVILRGLRKLLYWNELGLEIIGEAYDGAELRRMIDETPPDLIISDISMPHYSGIDIIRYIHEKSLRIKVIFISAYRDFSYAQDALEYNAVGYLVKPVNRGQLEQMVHKAIGMIGDQSQRHREREIAVRFERVRRSESITDQLVRLTDGDRRAAAALLGMGVISRSNYMTILFGEIDAVTDDKRSESAWKLQNFAVSNVLDEAVSQANSGIYFQKGRLHGIFLQHDAPEEATAMAQDFHDKLGRFVKVGFTIGVGVSVSLLEDTINSAYAAMQALQSRFIAGCNRVLAGVQDAGSELDPGMKSTINEWIIQLVHAIVTPGQEHAEDIYKRLKETWSLAAASGKNAAVASIYGAIIRIKQELKEYGVFEGMAELGDLELLSKLDRSLTLGDMAEHADSAFAEICREAAARLGSKEITQLVQVKNYMEQHYAENITLESMAALVYMNPYYFSTFFKKHTGENFKQYLTELRIRHGLRLLLETEMLVYEIAEKVGYNNARQFSKMFRLRYGMLPLEYKLSLSEEAKS